MPLRPRSRGHAPEGAEETLAHADALYNLARYLTQDPSEAEDLVQETYLRALRGWSEFAPGTNLKAWLFRILRNVFIRRYRQGLRHPTPSPYDTTEPPLDDAAGDRSAPSTPEPAQLRRVLAGEIEAALRTLSEDARTVILLDLEGLTEGETALVVRCAVGTVRGEADLALRLFRPREPGLVARRVGVLPYGLYAAPSYLARAGTPRRAAELRRHDVIGLDVDLESTPEMRWLSRHIPEESFRIRASTIPALLAACRAGMGIATVAERFVEGDGSLVRILPKVAPPQREAWLVLHPDLRRTARIAAVSRWIAEALAAPGA